MVSSRASFYTWHYALVSFLLSLLDNGFAFSKQNPRSYLKIADLPTYSRELRTIFADSKRVHVTPINIEVRASIWLKKSPYWFIWGAMRTPSYANMSKASWKSGSMSYHWPAGPSLSYISPPPLSGDRHTLRAHLSRRHALFWGGGMYSKRKQTLVSVCLF